MNTTNSTNSTNEQKNSLQKLGKNAKQGALSMTRSVGNIAKSGLGIAKSGAEGVKGLTDIFSSQAKSMGNRKMARAQGAEKVGTQQAEKNIAKAERNKELARKKAIEAQRKTQLQEQKLEEEKRKKLEQEKNNEFKAKQRELNRQTKEMIQKEKAEKSQRELNRKSMKNRRKNVEIKIYDEFIHGGVIFDDILEKLKESEKFKEHIEEGTLEIKFEFQSENNKKRIFEIADKGKTKGGWFFTDYYKKILQKLEGDNNLKVKFVNAFIDETKKYIRNRKKETNSNMNAGSRKKKNNTKKKQTKKLRKKLRKTLRKYKIKYN
tara:strand:+ start:2847 stop:3806 length:960 start_codon:yes stop_codon:yes gene_type:complete